MAEDSEFYGCDHDGRYFYGDKYCRQCGRQIVEECLCCGNMIYPADKFCGGCSRSREVSLSLPEIGTLEETPALNDDIIFGDDQLSPGEHSPAEEAVSSPVRSEQSPSDLPPQSQWIRNIVKRILRQ